VVACVHHGLAHTPKPDTIAPLPMRQQRRAKGLEVNTLVGGTLVRMYRQRPPKPTSGEERTRRGPYPSVAPGGQLVPVV
jgi:hypothetical protein